MSLDLFDHEAECSDSASDEESCDSEMDGFIASDDEDAGSDGSASADGDGHTGGPGGFLDFLDVCARRDESLARQRVPRDPSPTASSPSERGEPPREEA